MAVSAQAYFNALKAYIEKSYKVKHLNDGRIELVEKVYFPGDQSPTKIKIRFPVSGDALVVKLDKYQKKPLFHFLENDSKPWAKKCDFVVFNRVGNSLKVHCIEFKSGSLPDDLKDQLSAGVAWCRTLHSTIKHYTGTARKLDIMKYVFSCHQNPVDYLQDDRKYLKRDHTIRHYHYDELVDMALVDLENENVEGIR